MDPARPARARGRVMTMRVLALDTTSPEGSVAIVDDAGLGRVEAPLGDPSRSHAERLPQALLDTLTHAKLSLSDVDVFGVVSGPGSFTGLRIGIATVQGLALTTGRPVVAASALDLLCLAAAAGQEPGTTVGAWIDARRQDVYAQLQRVVQPSDGYESRLLELDAARVDRPAAVLADWAARTVMPEVLVGDGAVLHAGLLPDSLDVRPIPALAGVLAQWALARAREGRTIAPAAVRPVYVRRPDAEVARDGLARAGLAARESSG